MESSTGIATTLDQIPTSFLSLGKDIYDGRAKGSAEAERMLIFRDWLRENSQDRNRYAKSKQKLAKRNWKYVQNYADAKSEVVESIIARTRGQGKQGQRHFCDSIGVLLLLWGFAESMAGAFDRPKR